jgi:hypothetical protein
MMRLASVLLVLTLLTTSVISGTFAKYVTSDGAESSARVAKWGVTVEASSDLFQDSYATNDAVTDSSNISLSVRASDKQDEIKGDDDQVTQEAKTGALLVAPGTSGSLTAFTLNGSPEVAVSVSYSATLTLTGWEYKVKDGDSEKTVTYCPIVITVGSTKYQMGTKPAYDENNKLGTDNSKLSEDDYNALNNIGTTYYTIEAFQNGVNDAIAAYSKNYAANTDLSSLTDAAPSIGWLWAFSDGAEGAYQTDAADTALGNLATAPTISLDVTATVTQID